MSEHPRPGTEAVTGRGDDEAPENPRDDVDARRDDDEEELPPLTEQVSQQLGGVRGLIESGIPIAVFILTNMLWDDALNWAIAASVGVALAIAAVRLLRKQPVRHAVNGLLGIGIGAYMAWNSGKEEDFYLFGIIQGIVYGLVLLGSVTVRHPLVGWLWSVIAGGGKHEWREDDRLVRVFGWVTVLWGVVFVGKNLVRLWLYWMEMGDVLGLVTLLGGYPVTALLFLITIWAVRRTRPGMALNLKTG